MRLALLDLLSCITIASCRRSPLFFNFVPTDGIYDILNLVKFYWQKDGVNRLTGEVDNSNKWAGGGYVSSAADMLAFGKSHLTTDFLTDKTLNQWTTPQTTNNGQLINYGIGWQIGQDKKGRKWFGHSGGSVGGTSMLLIFPQEKIVVVTLTNVRPANTIDLAHQIANQFLKQ